MIVKCTNGHNFTKHTATNCHTLLSCSQHKHVAQMYCVTTLSMIWKNGKSDRFVVQWWCCSFSFICGRRLYVFRNGDQKVLGHFEFVLERTHVLLEQRNCLWLQLSVCLNWYIQRNSNSFYLHEQKTKLSCLSCWSLFPMSHTISHVKHFSCVDFLKILFLKIWILCIKPCVSLYRSLHLID